MRVVLANMYSMAVARRKFDEGRYPRHNLFGGLALEQAGHEVVYVGGTRLHAMLDPVTHRLRHRLGDLASQVETVTSGRGADVYVGLADSTLTALALLRSSGALRTPVCALFHERPRPSAWTRTVIRGYDLIFALNRHVHAGLLELGHPPERTIHLPWGPQVDFAGYVGAEADRAEEYVISCGKTLRDIDTLAAALSTTDIPALIYAPHDWQPPPGGAIRVRRFPPMPGYSAVMRDMVRASIVAVPRLRPDRMAGVSELNDALALGKPVVMTRSPHIDYDIEAVGCGVFVEPGDVAGWRSVLERLAGDPELRRDMGRRGREFAERECNIERYDRHLVEALEALVAETADVPAPAPVRARRAPTRMRRRVEPRATETV